MGVTIKDSTPAPLAQRQVAPAQQSDGSLLNFVALAVQDPNVDVTKLEALLRMQREIVGDDARTQFNRALHEAQMEMPRVSKDGTISLGQGKGSIPFATWENVDSHLRPIMRKHGFSLSFNMRKNDTGFIIEATLTHAAGHSKNYEMPLPNDAGPGRNALQAAGSTLSYGKRYLAEMIFNIVRGGEDDDGAKACGVITEAQKDELVELMQETNADTKKFLAYMRVASLDDMPAGDFERAKAALLAKKGSAK